MPDIDELITKRRNAVMNDWPSFLRQASPFVVEEVIERSKAGLPDYLVPWAPGTVVASKYLLKAANCHPRANRWDHVNSHCFATGPVGEGLAVYKRENIWYIDCGQTALVYTFGSLPVGARTSEEAILLAEFCYPSPRGAAASFRWVSWYETGILDC